jgi:hypothetical protein
MDVKNYQYKGKQEYTNNSPDTFEKGVLSLIQ